MDNYGALHDGHRRLEIRLVNNRVQSTSAASAGHHKHVMDLVIICAQHTCIRGKLQ